MGAGRRRRRRGAARPADEALEALVARVAQGGIRTSGAQLTATVGRRKRRILVVEDDPDVRRLVTEVCRLQGHEVLPAANGAEAIELGTGGQPDLVVVDWVLPDISGTEVILELKRQGVMSPMVLLGARSSQMDEVVGLEVGADDYISKPFDSRVLGARINAHLRRAALTETAPGRDAILTVGALKIDNAARRVSAGDREIPLTLTEFNLLTVLATSPERVFTRAQLRDRVWGYPHDLDDHSVDPHVQRLRRKLSDLASAGLSLEAVPGLGYRLSVKPVRPLVGT